MSTKATFEQGQLQLQIFEMRREARLRQARDWFVKHFFADNMEDAMKVAPFGSEGGTFTMMVTGYWEMACAYLNHGLLNENLFFETNGEFFGVWERIKPSVPGLRKMFSHDQYLGNMEKAAERYEKWMEARSPGHIAGMREFMKQMRSQMEKAA
jgi:hypothetical protein